MGKGDTLFNAVIGAIVTVLLSFTGFSPLLGGGVAGYLHQEDPKSGAKVGAISGVFAAIPFVFIFLLFVIFVLMGSAMGGMPGGPELLIILLIGFPFLLLWNVGLSAVGGYLGGYLRREYRADRTIAS